MKTISLVLAAMTGIAIFISPSRAEEPAPPAVSPDVQALLGELAKLGAVGNGKEDPQIDVQALFGMLLKMVPAAAAAASDAPKTTTGAAAKDAQGQELQAQLTALIKALSKMAADDAAAPAPDAAATQADPAAAVSTATSGARPAPAPGANPKPSALNTGSLNGASLAPSSSLNGRGATGGTPKLTDSEWRALFPASNDRK